jgi:hypothetical protein
MGKGVHSDSWTLPKYKKRGNGVSNGLEQGLFPSSLGCLSERLLLLLLAWPIIHL